MSAQTYQGVQDTLGSLHCDIGASECHGMLCGMLCGPAPFSERSWLEHVSGQDDLSAWQTDAVRAVFAELLESTRALIMADAYEFTLLLPADDAPLTERAAAFAAWCRGFLSGFGLSGIADLKVLGDDARDFLRDVERFCSIALDDDAGDDDERALTELTEFTRMGVLIVRADAQAGASDPVSTLH